MLAIFNKSAPFLSTVAWLIIVKHYIFINMLVYFIILFDFQSLFVYVEYCSI